MHLCLLPNNEIDKVKWDKNLSNFLDKNIYGCAWYLDVIYPGWKAIVTDEYDFLFPVFEKKKVFFNYILQPVLVQQITFYSKSEVTSDIFKYVINELEKKYLFIYLRLSGSLEGKISNISAKIERRINYILDLSYGYNEIYRGYNENTKRNIKKAEKNKLDVRVNTETPEVLTNFLKQQLSTKVKLKNYYYHRISSLIKKGLERKSVKNFIAYNNENKMIGFTSFFYEFDRCYYLFAASNEEGREKGAMFKIVDVFIKENAGKNLILSFEGSMIESIARFFRGFGAVNENYFSYFWVKFPFLKNIIKL